MFDFLKKKKAPFITAVIAAGGSSQRMGGGNKLLADLGGIPVLAHTLRAFEINANISEIIISAKEDMIITYADMAKTYGITKVTKVIAGGADRNESVYKGVCSADKKAQFILVHDGARPLVPQEVIDRVVEALKTHNCAAAAVNVKDTIRILDRETGGYRLLPREDVRAMQTPQGADKALLTAALQNCIEKKITVTDDCAALELLGAKPILVDGSYRNLKITTKEDIISAEALLGEDI